MSRTIEVPDDVYSRIEEAASTSGNSVAEVIALRFPGPASPTSASENGSEQAMSEGSGAPRTLADEFAGLVGLVDSGRTDLSQRTGELFAQGMLTKRQEGRL